MNRKILLQVTAPAVLLGVLLLATCLGSVYAISKLQTNLADILSANVASLQAAQQLEIRFRQLRFHSLVNFIEPSLERQTQIDEDNKSFEQAIQRAATIASSAESRKLVRAIQVGYERYRIELDQKPPPTASRNKDLIRWVDTHPVRHLIAPCKELLRVNRQEMERTSQESEEVSQKARAAILLLGIAGPLAGLIGGYGIARGLSRSIARLNVWVRDVHAQIDQQAGVISLESQGDLQNLDQQLQRVVSRVQELVEQLQQQQEDMLRAEQLAAVGQLAASVAHEVRNPLTAIKLLIENALRQEGGRGGTGTIASPSHAPFLSQRAGGLTPDDLEVIHGEIKRLEQTVQGLLDFARLPQADPHPCDLRELVAHAVELVRARANQQGVAIEVQQPGQPVTASVDRSQLETVMVNLCLNALDAMPTGGRLEIDLQADVEPGDPPGGRGVRVEVRDTGRGIDPTIAGRLFTPFTTTKATGTGLGLSICRRVMEGHGGSINARNRTQGGAVFTLCLPRVSAGRVRQSRQELISCPAC